MKTKYLISFLNRAVHFDADLELLDGISTLQSQGKLYDPQTGKLFSFLDETKHPILWKRQDSSHNRLMAVNHLKSSFYGGCIKDIYEYLTMYFQDILKAAAQKGLDPDRLVGEHNTSFSANDLLACKSHDAVIGLVTRSIFRSLENEKSTKKIIQKINKKLNLEIDEALINAAMPYLELRHLLVHADGYIDDKFVESYPNFEPDIVKKNSKIKLKYHIVDGAKCAISNLVKEYDKKLIEKSLVLSSDIQN